MKDYAETETSLIFKKPFFKSMMLEHSKELIKETVLATRQEMSKEIELNTSQISKLLNVEERTVLKYMNEGAWILGSSRDRKSNKIKLNHTKHGKKYTASKFDVLQFKKKLKSS